MTVCKFGDICKKKKYFNALIEYALFLNRQNRNVYI